LALYDLTTQKGMEKALFDLYWHDHGFLRENFQNDYEISPGVWRSNQPNPKQLAQWKERGIKTVFNLRGDHDACFTALEIDACQKLGLKLEFFKMQSRDGPRPEMLRALEKAFREAEYPILLHCKSGADRAGIAASFYKFIIEGKSVAEAKEQLSFKYLHIKLGKTGVLGHFWDKFDQANKATGITFWDWIDNEYDPMRLYDDFKPNALGIWVTDKVLHRE
jgi:protein tyrosine/serine phosphatase